MDMNYEIKNIFFFVFVSLPPDLNCHVKILLLKLSLSTFNLKNIPWISVRNHISAICGQSQDKFKYHASSCLKHNVYQIVASLTGKNEGKQSEVPFTTHTHSTWLKYAWVSALGPSHNLWTGYMHSHKTGHSRYARWNSWRCPEERLPDKEGSQNENMEKTMVCSSENHYELL